MDSAETVRDSVEPNKENVIDKQISDNRIGGIKDTEECEQICKLKCTKPEERDGTINQTLENTCNSTGGIINKSVRFSETEIAVSDTEDECTGGGSIDLVHVNPNNPRITISEPVGSPCSENNQKKASVPKGRCPMYFGIKSYIHDFYLPPDKEIFKSGEYIQEDDFQWVVEPGKRRWKGCWFRTGLWVGVNLMLLGVIAMLVGHLTTPRQTVVSQQEDFTVLDRWAVTFNNRLLVCQLAGLAGFTCGAVIVMLALLVSSYQQEQTRGYYVMAATVVPETFMRNPSAGYRQGWGSHRIPLSGSITGVQPTFVRTH